MTILMSKFNIFSSNICALPEGVRRGHDKKVIGASVLTSACEPPVITNNSSGGTSVSPPEVPPPHQLWTAHSGVWITSQDERLLTHSFGELPLETAVALKPWKESKTTFEGNERHPFVRLLQLEMGPTSYQQKHPSVCRLLRPGPTTAQWAASWAFLAVLLKGLWDLII